MVNALTERLKNPKITSIEYTDDYSREWFKYIFHMNKNLKLDKMNISTETLLN